MEDSILISIKKLLGISAADTSFDIDVITHINSTFSTLTQLGVGPSNGFRIDSSLVNWSDYIPEDDNRLELIKTYMFMKVKLMFDPPSSGTIMDSYNRQINELEWRINSIVDCN